MSRNKKRKGNEKSTKEKPKTYSIKMPVYTTSMMDEEEGLFGKATYDEMMVFLRNRLSSFSSPISTDNRNKTKKTVISKIDSTEVSIGNVPSLLLQINAFNTNLYDGYFEETLGYELLLQEPIEEGNEAACYVIKLTSTELVIQTKGTWKEDEEDGARTYTMITTFKKVK